MGLPLQVTLSTVHTASLVSTQINAALTISLEDQLCQKKPYHHFVQAKKERLSDAGGGRLSRLWTFPAGVETGASVAHPVHNLQLHIIVTAGRSVGHQCYVLVAGVQAGVEGPVALFEANTIDSRPVSPVADPDREIPHGHAAVLRAVGLQLDQLAARLSEVRKLRGQEKVDKVCKFWIISQ